MRVVQRAHVYELKNKIKGTQRLQFFKDLPDGAKDNHDGVLCQEVVRVLLDRYLDLYTQAPCDETHKIVVLLREVLVLGETRAFRRTIEKSYAKTGLHVEELPVGANGHVFDMKANDEN